MRLDYVTIFPGYLEPLSLSLPGRAVASGLLAVGVHDLRDFAHDRHRTVDDSPAGGGAGMVMRPEPWGEALDAVLPDGATLVVPSPAGRRFTQALAADLATREHLVFACGRYEGIDQRVLDDTSRRAEVLEVSLGDYVLNGGEVAALAVTEAVVRLLPGFMGNAASLEEESHVDGLLEAPSYTRPASWRGLDVPPVLLSGNHAAIARWRTDEAVRRTAERRPDLRHPASVAPSGGWEVVPAVRADAGELMTLQRACWLQEALALDTVRGIPALEETFDEVVAELEGRDRWTTWVARHAGRLVGSVRARPAEGQATVWEIGRLMVAPDLQRQGLGRVLLDHAHDAAPETVTSYRLVTGHASTDNQRFYRRAGYSLRPDLAPPPMTVVLTRPRRR